MQFYSGVKNRVEAFFPCFERHNNQFAYLLNDYLCSNFIRRKTQPRDPAMQYANPSSEKSQNVSIKGSNNPIELMEGVFPQTATTLFGLEEVLKSELEQLGASDIKVARRAVTYRGDKAMLYRANYRLRCALRVLVPILSFEASNTDELYQKSLEYPWHTIMPHNSSFFIDTAVFSTLFTNSRFALYRVKDAIRDYDRESAYPHNLQVADSRKADIIIHLHISEKKVVISLDSSGESLHHRGYRTGYNAAPLNEVLASGMLKLAGYDGNVTFFDPMCGSGTLPIEAAMIASNTPAGYYRKDFAFKHWLNFDEELWNNIKAETKRVAIMKPIIARDRDFRIVGIATGNIINANFRRAITIEQADFLKAQPPASPMLIVTNPPYGKRITHEDLEALYRGIGERLKHGYTGNTAWVLASPVSLFRNIGLAQGAKIKLFNGELECEFRKYELFEGKKKEHVASKNKQLKLEPKQYTPTNKKTFTHQNFTPNTLANEKPFEADRLYNRKSFQKPRRSHIARGVQVFGENTEDR